MRSILPVIFAIGLATAFSAASAQTTPATSPAATSPTTAAPATTPAQTTPANNDDVVSCRFERTTGSLMAKRICHTQREWHQMTSDSRDLMDNINAHDRLGAPVSN